MNASRILLPDLTARLFVLVSLFVFINITTGWALDGTWDSSSGSGDWTNSAKWNGGNIAGGTDATATFAGASGNTISLGTNSVTVGNLTVSNFSSSPKWIISGGTLILDVSSGKPLIKSTNTTVQDILTIDSTIAGTNGFAVDLYNSRLYLSGSNTFTGGVNLISGTLWTKNADALNGNTVTISGNGSVATLGGAGNSTYTGNFVIANNSTRFIMASSTSFIFSGNISETGGSRTVSFTTDGVDAKIALTGSNSYSGGTQIGATHKWGSIVLQVKNSNSLGTGTNVFFGAGTKDHDNDVLELSDDVTITGKTLTLRGRGTNGVGSLHSSSGTNTWAGNIDTGTYSTTPTIGVTSGKLQVSGVVSGANSNGLAKVGDGLLAFTGSNTYTGGTIISGGTLSLGDGGTSGSVVGNINITNSGATLKINRSDNVTLSNVVSGAGNFTQAGAGTTTLTADNTFTGAATVTSGTLALNATSGSALGTTTSVTVNSGAILLLSKSAQVKDTATVTLSGGTIHRESGVSEIFSDLNLTAGSFLDYGTGTAGTLTFGTYTPSSLLTVNNFFEGNKLVFSSNIGTNVNSTNFFKFDNAFATNWNGSTFTITAIPESSTYLTAAGLVGMMLLCRRRTKRACGMYSPRR